MPILHLLEAILRQFEEVAEYRIEVRTEREMHHLKLEIEPQPEAVVNVENLIALIRRTIKDRLNFHPDVVAVPAGSLPRFELKGQRFFRRSE